MVCGLALIFLVALLIVVFPTEIVAWYATYCRNSYPDKRSLEQRDELLGFSPWNKFLFGKFSDFATRGPEHPEEFPRLIWFVRLLGIFLIMACMFALLFTTLKPYF